MISPFRLPSTVETERTCSHSSPLHTSIISFMYDVHASLVATPESRIQYETFAGFACQSLLDSGSLPPRLLI